MTLEQLREEIPDYAKDLRLNLTSALRQTELTERQLWGTAVACSLAGHNARLYSAVLHDAAEHLDETALNAAKSAAAIMGMNNIYYRFIHLASNHDYAAMRAGLRMNAIRTHGVSQADFELWSLAVSAINGCGSCMDSHEKVVREKGLSEAAVLAAVRIAAVLHAVARVLDADQAPAAA
jgi:alkyl hydroperoxide reductase subunit D